MVRTNTAIERRAEIIAAAIRVLARNGLAETTTRKIAAEAGLNQATLRYYFGSKDDLLFAVLQDMMRVTREITFESTRMGKGVRETLSESIRAFWAHVEEMPELQIMQYELTLYSLRHPESAWIARQQYDGYSAVVETLLQHHFETAHQSCAIPVSELARFIIGGVDGLILQFISDRDTARARRDLDHLLAATIALAEGTPSS
jgi:AcrR family transcriptional regulator